MIDRQSQIAAFVANAGWADAARVNIAGDASARRYQRLTREGVSPSRAILMDAPGSAAASCEPFIAIAQHLRHLGLSAPAHYASDPEAGLLLIEDLGDDLFARLIVADPPCQNRLYTGATDVLLTLRTAPVPPGLPRADAGTLAALTDLALTDYAGAIVPMMSDQARRRLLNRFEDILRPALRGDPVLILRDYHAENLLWLPDRDGVARVGLLDFQDAMVGHPAYDLVSLLQDARRDVPPATEARMIDHYLTASGEDDHAFRTTYAVIAVQRHLRILGVFARLATKYGKPGYIDLIPRTWDHLVRGLDHPALAPVADTLLQHMPPPNTENLTLLRATCP